MDSIGFIAASLMGLILGLLGGGGSMLTVPILFYIFKLPAVIATGYSLIVVGITSLIGAVHYGKDRLVEPKTAILFALPSMAGVFTARKWLVPSLPEAVELGLISITKDQTIMIAFASLILAVSVSMLMIKREELAPQRLPDSKTKQTLLLAGQGLLTGIVTGFVGAGGGFIIVPILILLTGLPVRKAIATSLFIIAINSTAGIAGDISEGLTIDPFFLGKFIAFTIVGVVVGSMINRAVPVALLRKGLAYFVFTMGVLIMLKELF